MIKKVGVADRETVRGSMEGGETGKVFRGQIVKSFVVHVKDM